MSGATRPATFATLEPGVLTVSVFTGFEPFAFHRDGRLIGFDVDIIRSFAAAAQLEVAFLPRERFEDIWREPAAGAADLAAAGIACFVERASPDIAWSEPYFEVCRSILVHAGDAGRLRGMDDFAGRAIAFVRGSTADLDTRQRAPAGARLVPIENQPEGMHLLRSRAIDGLAMGAPSNEYNLLMHPGFVVIDRHEFSQPEGLRFPVSAGNRTLLDALNRFIARVRATGEIRAHVARWMAG